MGHGFPQTCSSDEVTPSGLWCVGVVINSSRRSSLTGSGRSRRQSGLLYFLQWSISRHFSLAFWSTSHGREPLGQQRATSLHKLRSPVRCVCFSPFSTSMSVSLILSANAPPSKSFAPNPLACLCLQGNWIWSTKARNKLWFASETILSWNWVMPYVRVALVWGPEKAFPRSERWTKIWSRIEHIYLAYMDE